VILIRFADIHYHPDFEDFNVDREETLEKAWKSGVEAILNFFIPPALSRPEE